MSLHANFSSIQITVRVGLGLNNAGTGLVYDQRAQLWFCKRCEFFRIHSIANVFNKSHLFQGF